MHMIIRLVLIASVLLAAYSVVLTLYLFPWAWAAIAIGAAYGAARKGRALYAHGTARFADITDLPGAQDE